MRILYRSYKDYTTKYLWADVLKEKLGYGDICVKDEEGRERTVYLIDVLKVENTYSKNKYCVCNSCKEIIKNTDEAKIRHFKAREKKINCSKCSKLYLHATDEIISDVKYLKDGTFEKTKTYKGELLCSNGYPKAKINVCQENGACMYTRCSHLNSFVPANEVIPKLLRPEKLATIRELEKIGFAFTEPTTVYGNRVMAYKYKNRDLYALVDYNGIVVAFKSNGILFQYVYQKKIYVVYNSKYTEDYYKEKEFDCYDYVKKVMGKIFKEVN